MTISIKSPTSTTGSIQKNGSDVITIDASDNVTVANDLTVSGTISGTGTSQWSTSGSNISYTTGNVGIGKDTLLSFYPADQSYANIKFEWDTGDAGYLHSTAYNGMKWTANGSERMRIDSSGNVMMGTTTRSNNEKVTIYQSVAQAMGISVRTSGGPALGNYESSDQTHATYWTFGRDNQITGNYVFASGGTLRGSISYTTGTYTAISDSRLKKNITNITYGLNEVMAFRPVTYLMNEEDDTAKKHLGFIAQEVKTLVDEAVDDLIDPDTQFYMLDKGGLVPVLVKAIQEQQAIIETLTTRIEALESN